MQLNLTELPSLGSPELLRRMALCFALGLTTFVGCSNSDKHPLTGRVTTEAGEPVVAASLQFRSDEHTCRANTDEEGNYTVSIAGKGEGAPAGTYRVSIMEYTGDPENPAPRVAHVKYASAKKSGLVVTVPTESGTFDIVLDSAEKRRKK
ncbi:carboxypeptidase-like regulatory domain-containing protein [Adhaeretor mobilis]|uniref:Carboxypeptidase regulatory-like domain-containing protein n=1 Tax=Adhaeretor mobilis TaxID=1930276 RepID=A0A517MPV1_9BACT|nr:carboxypeptidase-like regulatory domain-containing protein [Adhaeretor mobilis]QDS96915.1 hypothetical protein HG15A2_01740 [Adhaeretor mobilis]